jgi:hypothetical protein
MKLVATLAAAAMLTLSTAALAQTTPAKPAAPAAAAAAPVKLEKPASVTQEAWDKMSEADKKKAVEAAKSTAKPAAEKKPKKGGC